MNTGHLSKSMLTSSFLKRLDLLENNSYTVSIESKLFATFVFLAVTAAHTREESLRDRGGTKLDWGRLRPYLVKGGGQRKGRAPA